MHDYTEGATQCKPMYHLAHREVFAQGGVELGLEAELLVERGRLALAPDDSRLVDGLVELARRDEDGQVRAAREAGALPLVEDEHLQLVVVDHVGLAHVVQHAVPRLGEEAKRLVAER